MEKLKILVLYYQTDTEPADVVAAQVLEALKANGHNAAGAGIFREVSEIVAAVRRRKPDLVVNLCETFAEDPKLEPNVAGVLELMGQPFTGAGMVGLVLAQDKVLTKMVMTSHGLRAPSAIGVFHPDGEQPPSTSGNEPRFPALVKPSSLDASLGIDREAVVRDWDSLVERVRYIQEKFADVALVEEFIDGREFYAGVVGNGASATALPVLEMAFKGYEKGEAKIVTSDAKWNAESEEYKRTTLVRPRRLTAELEASIQNVAKQALAACNLRDYGRVDMRVRRGKPFVLEVNSNPYLAHEAELATAAKEAGLDYNGLIGQIVEHAWRRYHPEGAEAKPAPPPEAAPPPLASPA